jgi:hypothetical protein
MIEYMASGLPVVSVEWDELRCIDSPAFLSKSKEHFVENIKLALLETDLNKYKSFAKKNDWREKLKLII